MTSPVEDLLQWRARLHRYAEDYDASPEKLTLDEVWERAGVIGKSSCRSWMGYHANVYYRDFAPPPPGDHFDVQNGTAGTYFAGPNPNWIEQSAQDVRSRIVGDKGEQALDEAQRRAEEGANLLSSAKADISSILTLYLEDHQDTFVRRIAEEIEQTKVLDATDIANEMSPKRQVVTQDLKAAQQGTWPPPHRGLPRR